MSRNGSLLSFFKPQPQRKPEKRPLQVDHFDAAEAAADGQRIRPKSPRFNTRHVSATSLPTSKPKPKSTMERNPSTTIGKKRSVVMSDTSSLTSLSDAEPMSSPSGVNDTAMIDTSQQVPKLNESFMSTLSSVPGSSQRVVRDGEEMVLGSDEDSDDSLGELDRIIGNLKPKKPPVPATPSSTTTPQTRNHLPTRNTRSKDSIFKPRPKPEIRKYKFSLDALAAKIEKEATHNNEVQKAILEAELSDKKIASLAGKATDEVGINEIKPELLAAVINDEDDPDNFERIIKAVGRTEALQHKKRWQFFGRESSPLPPPKFPKLKDELLVELLKDPLDREATILGGVLAEVASIKVLPVELVRFVIDTAVAECRRDIQSAYCEVLGSCSNQASKLIDLKLVCVWFSSLGASEVSLTNDHMIEPALVENKDRKSHEKDWIVLRNILRVLTIVATDLSSDLRTNILILLLQVALDTEVVADAGNVILLKAALNAIVDQTPEDNLESVLTSCMKQLSEHVHDPQLRINLLRMLTSSSSRVCWIRKRIATAFFFGRIKHIESWPGTPIPSWQYTKHLRTKSQFDIKEDMDYAWLGAAITSLDISIDNGDPPHNVDVKAEKQFNHGIDDLSATLHYMHANIKDSGANHLARIEAKEALELLQGRLAFAVRTRRKQKESIFGESTSNQNIKDMFTTRLKGLETVDGAA